MTLPPSTLLSVQYAFTRQLYKRCLSFQFLISHKLSTTPHILQAARDLSARRISHLKQIRGQVCRESYSQVYNIFHSPSPANTNNAQTGGSGFIAAHVLEVLLERGHSVVTTVRSTEKGQKILDNHPKISKNRLDFVIVEDIAKPGSFDHAVQSNPPFETIIHTASPFHLNITDTKKDLLDPAVIGTTGVLASAKNYAPTVKRVVRLILMSLTTANHD